MARLRRRSAREAPSRCCEVPYTMLCCRVETSLVRCKGTRHESLYMRSAGQACFFRTPSVRRSRSCPWSCVFLSSISLCRCLAIFRRRQGGVSYAGQFLRACARWIAPTRPGRTSRLFACCSVMSHGLGRNAFFSVGLAMHVWRVEDGRSSSVAQARV